jgi:hypothetical protein
VAAAEAAAEIIVLAEGIWVAELLGNMVFGLQNICGLEGLLAFLVLEDFWCLVCCFQILWQMLSRRLSVYYNAKSERRNGVCEVQWKE